MAVKVAINGLVVLVVWHFRQMFGAEGYVSRSYQRSDESENVSSPVKV